MSDPSEPDEIGQRHETPVEPGLSAQGQPESGQGHDITDAAYRFWSRLGCFAIVVLVLIVCGLVLVGWAISDWDDALAR